MTTRFIKTLIVTLAYWLQSIRIQLSALAGTYGIATCIFLILRWQIGERWEVIAISNNFIIWILLGSVIGFLVALLAVDTPFWLLYNIPGIIMLGIWYGPLFLPFGSPNIQNGVFDVTVATYNVASARNHPEALRAEITSMSPDIIALQEITPAFIEEMQEHYPNTIYVGTIALLSRYPIVEELSFAVQEGDQPNARVGAFRTVVMVRGQPIAVYVVHPTRPELDVRRLSYDAEPLHVTMQGVAMKLESESFPTILLCDCNFSDKSDDYQLIATSLRDGWRHAGRGFGFTAPANNWYGMPYLLVRSDYIWLSEHFEIKDITVVSGRYSDHLPVQAELVLVKPVTASN